jgi:catechol 2,3-dioxygenase-like lactoylglutathione lyase family enzyme
MTDILGLHHYAIRAVNWDDTVKFYIEGLGFEMVYPWTFEPTIKRSAFLRAPGGGYIEIFGPAPRASTVSLRALLRQVQPCIQSRRVASCGATRTFPSGLP